MRRSIVGRALDFVAIGTLVALSPIALACEAGGRIVAFLALLPLEVYEELRWSRR